MSNNLKHHIGSAIGLTLLMLWFWLLRELGWLDYASTLAPEGYGGAALTFAVGFGMIPGFWLWGRWQRWVDKKCHSDGDKAQG